MARAETLEGPDYRIIFPVWARAVADHIARELPRRRREAAAWLGTQPNGTLEVHLVEDYKGMLAAAGHSAPTWALAVTRADDRLVFRLDRLAQGPRSSLDVVLRHELIHQCINHYGRGRLPLWFEEGLCVHWAGSPYLKAASTVESMAAAGTLPTLDQTSRGFSRDGGVAAVSYETSKKAMGYFLAAHGPDAMRKLLEEVHGGKPFGDAFESSTGQGVPQFEEQWRIHVTPALPFLIDFFLRNLELTLLALGGLIVAGGYVRYRLKRKSKLEELG